MAVHRGREAVGWGGGWVWRVLRGCFGCGEGRGRGEEKIGQDVMLNKNGLGIEQSGATQRRKKEGLLMADGIMVKGEFHEPTNPADERHKTADLYKRLICINKLISRPTNLCIVLWSPTSH